MKIRILCSITFSWKSHRLRDNVEKCGGDGGATNDVTIWRIRLQVDWQGYMHVCACLRPRARVPTCTHTRMHTHRQICNTSCFSTTAIRVRPSMLRYTYIVPLVLSSYLLLHSFSFHSALARRTSRRCLGAFSVSSTPHPHLGCR
jgi:hypothetical protein